MYLGHGGLTMDLPEFVAPPVSERAMRWFYAVVRTFTVVALAVVVVVMWAGIERWLRP